MIAAHVAFFLHLILFPATRHIHLASQNRLERLLTGLLTFFVYALTIIIEFLYTEHVAVIGDGHTFHSVADGLIHKALHPGLAVEN